jgi:hypothetical protein
MYFDLNHHSQINKIYIDHSKLVPTILGKKEIIKNIFFELRRLSKN